MTRLYEGNGIDDRDIPTVTYRHDDDSVVVIVGSGAGGGTMADELSRNGIDTIVLEAGPRFQEGEFINDEWEMYDRFTWNDKRFATGSSPTVQNFPTAPTWTCKGLGGSTLHWAALCPRGEPYEFKTRSVYGAIDGANIADWPLQFDELEPFYAVAEDKMGISGRNGLPFHRGSTAYKVMALGAKRMGYRNFDTGHSAINVKPRDGRNACDQIGFCMQGCKSGARWSTLTSELPRAEATGRCEIRTHCMALRIEHDREGRISGILYADRKGCHHFQKARVVCVAANSIETPRLLLNSESSSFRDGLANGSGQVGRNYMRHVSGYLYGVFGQPVRMYRGIVSNGSVRDEAHHDESRGFAGGFNFSSVGLGLPFYAAFLSPRSWGREYTDWIEAYEHVSGMTVLGEDLAMADNRVTLHPSENDQYGLPIPCLHLDDHANDIVMKSYAYRKGTELLEAAGATRVFQSPPLPVSHNMGTSRMSAEPEGGVVNRWGQSHEISNLFVSDGSVFTSSMAGNPTLTIVALALRQAAYIVKKMRSNQL